MAAEYVFYGQNTTGVTGDVRQRHRARGADGRVPRDGPGARSTWPTGSTIRTSASEAEARVRERFEAIGYQIMNRSPGELDSDTFAATLLDRAKRPLVADTARPGLRRRLPDRAPEPRRRPSAWPTS